MKQRIILISLVALGLALVLAVSVARCADVRVDTLWRPLPQKTLLMGDVVNTYAGDTVYIYRENEIGMYTLDTALCVLKITEKKNGGTDILNCDKSIYRLKPKQFFRRK